MAWCDRNGIEINKEKSNIIQIRADRLTRLAATQVLGIPVKAQSQYLGVLIDNELSFHSEIKNLNESLLNLKKHLYYATQRLP